MIFTRVKVMPKIKAQIVTTIGSVIISSKGYKTLFQQQKA
jgi:hypothetical protein